LLIAVEAWPLTVSPSEIVRSRASCLVLVSVSIAVGLILEQAIGDAVKPGAFQRENAPVLLEQTKVVLRRRR